MRLTEEQMIQSRIETAVDAALKEQMERVKPYLNHKGDCLIYRDNYLEALMGGEDVERECNCGIEALKAELEGE